MSTTAPEVTAEATAADLRLTPFVVIGQPGKPGRCQAWMDAADRLCARPTDGHLCRRHRTVATKRRAVRLAEIEAREAKRAQVQQAKRTEARAHLEGDRAELARVSAQLERLTAPAVNDRAAMGGAVHPSIARRAAAQFSDSRISKVTALTARQERLRERIALAES